MKIGKILGFPVDLDWTWFLIFVVAVIAIQADLAQRVGIPGMPGIFLLIPAVFGSLLFFATLLGHELAHCVVARNLGIPISGITLFVFGGVARMKSEPGSPTDELKMALAGPAFSILTAAFLFLLYGAMILPLLINEVIRYVAIGNLVIALFNMIPAFPTDGGRALRAILWGATNNLQSATRTAATLGTGFGWLLIAWAIYRFLQGDWSGIWLGLIGYFLQDAAQTALQQVQWKKAMRGLYIRDFMNTAPVTLTADMTIGAAVYEAFFRQPSESYPVVDSEGTLVGSLHAEDIRQLDRGLWEAQTVESVMKPVSADCQVNPLDDAWQILTGDSFDCSSTLFAVDNGRLVGVVNQDTLSEQIRMRMQLQG